MLRVKKPEKENAGPEQGGDASPTGETGGVLHQYAQRQTTAEFEEQMRSATEEALLGLRETASKHPKEILRTRYYWRQLVRAPILVLSILVVIFIALVLWPILDHERAEQADLPARRAEAMTFFISIVRTVFSGLTDLDNSVLYVSFCLFLVSNIVIWTLITDVLAPRRYGRQSSLIVDVLYVFCRLIIGFNIEINVAFALIVISMWLSWDCILHLPACLCDAVARTHVLPPLTPLLTSDDYATFAMDLINYRGISIFLDATIFPTVVFGAAPWVAGTISILAIPFMFHCFFLLPAHELCSIGGLI